MRGGHDGWEALYKNPTLITMMRLFNPMRRGAIGVGGSKFVIVASVPFGGWGARPWKNRGKFWREPKSIFLKVSYYTIPTSS